MNDAFIDRSHPDEGRKERASSRKSLLKKNRKSRRRDRKEKRKNFRKDRQSRRKKERKRQNQSSKRKGGCLGGNIDCFLCEACCVMVPILFGIFLFVASLFVISVDKIAYSSYESPKDQCIVVERNPVKVSFVYDKKNYTKEMTKSYYMELNLQVGNIIPCVMNPKKADSFAAYDSNPQLIDLLSYVILGVSVVLVCLYLPFAILTVARCICCHCIIRCFYKIVLIVFNTIYLFFWVIFFSLFCLGVAHIIIRSVEWAAVRDLEKMKHTIVDCKITNIKCEYVYNQISLSYVVFEEDGLAGGSVSNNKTKPVGKTYDKNVYEYIPNMCYKKNNVIPCILNNKKLDSPQIYYVVPPSNWFWWIFGISTSIFFILCCFSCYGGCCLYPWFIIEAIIFGVQRQSGLSSKVGYESLGDGGIQ